MKKYFEELTSFLMSNVPGKLSSLRCREEYFLKHDKQYLLDFLNETYPENWCFRDKINAAVKLNLETVDVCHICKTNPRQIVYRENEGIALSKECSPKCTSIACGIKLTENNKTRDHKKSQEKRRQTSLKKYGYEYNSQRPEVKAILSEKLSKSQLAPHIREKLLDDDWLKQQYEVEKKSALQIGSELGCDFSTVLVYLRKFDHKIRTRYGRSLAEIQIEQFVQSLGIHCYSTQSNLSGKKEIDIYIPDYNVGIEMNGLKFHSCYSFETKDQMNRHLIKTEIAKDRGIHLVHILDYQWKHQRELCKSFIKNLLGKNETIGARKCTIKPVDKKLEKDFLNTNHFQGHAFSKVVLGLFLDDELMCIMTFCKSKHNKNYDWELLRFCNKMHFNVVGGFSRLLNAFRKEHEGTIITYANKQRSNGNVYEKNGFVLDHETKPGYFWTDGRKLFPKLMCQKRRLQDWLLNFDPIKSEAENMFANGYSRYWDSGQLVYCLK